MDFPVIHTNFWDGVIAVPLIVILTQIFKLFTIPRQYFPTIASILGFSISIFISHKHNLWAVYSWVDFIALQPLVHILLSKRPG